MSKKFKIEQLVMVIDRFPYEGKICKIVADKNTPWAKGTPFSFETVAVENGKDYIILIQQKSGEFSNELHVTENEIEPYS